MWEQGGGCVGLKIQGVYGYLVARCSVGGGGFRVCQGRQGPGCVENRGVGV